MTAVPLPRLAPDGSAERPVLRPGPVPAVADPPPAVLGADLLPPRRPRARLRPAIAGTAAAILAAGLVTALVTGPLTGLPAPARTDPAVLAQYDYALRVPDGWRHTGGLPERRRTLLTPAAAPEGSDLIAVEQTPLGYDSAAEPDRARTEFAERFAAAARAEPGLLGPPRPDRFGGRPVIAYRQLGGATTIDWYVVFDRDGQLSVGCRHTPSGAAAVATACAGVVASLTRRAP